MNESQMDKEIGAQISEEILRTNFSRRVLRFSGVVLTLVFGALVSFAAAKLSSDGIQGVSVIAALLSVIVVLVTNLLFLRTKLLRHERNRLEMLEKIWFEERSSNAERIAQESQLLLLQAEMAKAEADTQLQEILAKRLELIEKLQEMRLTNLETVFRDQETEGETVGF